MKRIRLLLMTAILVLGLAVPAFADKVPVNLNIYKHQTYPSGKTSHAQKAVEKAFFEKNEDGTGNLIIITKWFEFLGAQGTMTQIKYGPIESNEIIDPVYNNLGQLVLPLTNEIVTELEQKSIVQLPSAEVKNNVKFGLIHNNSYNKVDAVISY